MTLSQEYNTKVTTHIEVRCLSEASRLHVAEDVDVLEQPKVLTLLEHQIALCNAL